MHRGERRRRPPRWRTTRLAHPASPIPREIGVPGSVCSQSRARSAPLLPSLAMHGAVALRPAPTLLRASAAIRRSRQAFRCAVSSMAGGGAAGKVAYPSPIVFQALQEAKSCLIMLHGLGERSGILPPPPLPLPLPASCQPQRGPGRPAAGDSPWLRHLLSDEPPPVPPTATAPPWRRVAGDSGQGWADVAPMLQPDLPHTKFIFPTAPIVRGGGCSQPRRCAACKLCRLVVACLGAQHCPAAAPRRSPPCPPPCPPPAAPHHRQRRHAHDGMVRCRRRFARNTSCPAGSAAAACTCGAQPALPLLLPIPVWPHLRTVLVLPVGLQVRHC